MRRMQPVAYIRKSTRGGIDSRDDQIANVRAIVRPEDRAGLVILDGDWGVSASREKQAKRLDFRRLMDMVALGEVSHLYAYSADRLARNVGWSAQLLDACKDAHVSITTGERTFDPSDSIDRQMWHFMAMQNEAEVEKYQRKAGDRVRRMRARGAKLGPEFYGALPGEDVDAVLAAFEQSGSTHRAAIILNTANVPTRRGGPWVFGSVRQILVRLGRMPRLGTKGAKPHAPHIFYRLLRCHCGRTLSGVKTGPKRTIYRCVGASSDPRHGRKSVTEAAILPWAIAEAETYYPPDVAVMAEKAEAERAALATERAQATKLALVPGVDLDVVQERLADIDRRLEAIEDAVEVQDVSEIDWTLPPEAINTILRAYWRSIQLDEHLRPVRADWRFGPKSARSNG